MCAGATSSSKSKPFTERAPIDEADIIRRWQPLVRRVARGLSARLPSSVRVDDLHQEGLIALLLAVRASSRELTPAYLTIRVRGAMLDSVRRSYPRAVGNLVKRIAQAERSLAPGASHVEIAAAAGITDDQYHAALVAFGAYESATKHGRRVEDTHAASTADEPLQALLRGEQAAILADAIGRLPERERHVIEQTVAEGRSLGSVARDLGVSESRACQIRGDALRKMREFARRKS